MTPFESFTSPVVLLALDDLDTDQIIPARYMKCTDKVGLGEHLFTDCRASPDFADFSRRASGSSGGSSSGSSGRASGGSSGRASGGSSGRASGGSSGRASGGSSGGSPGARILLAGANFGCGSSREHAPWALLDWGFRAIVARSFADIFRQNATKNGVLPIALDHAAYTRVLAARTADPELALHVDLPAQRVAIAGDPGASFGFAIDPFAKHCLVNGVDELGYLLSFEDRITAHERRRP